MVATITGTWTDAGGGVPGSFDVDIPIRLRDVNTDTVIHPGGRYATGVLVAGAFTVTVPGSDDPNVSPQGWQATVKVSFPRTGGVERYVIDVLDGTTTDLADVVVTEDIPGSADILIRGVPGGLAELDEDGLVPAAQLPGLSDLGLTAADSPQFAGLTVSGGTSTSTLMVGTNNTNGITSSPSAYLTNSRKNFSTNQDLSLTVGYVSGTKNVSTRVHGYQANIRDDSTVRDVTVTGASDASPISITAVAHGWVTGTRVVVDSVGGNTAAIGSWLITVVDADTFTLDGSTGNGAYTSGGIVTNRPMYYGFFSVVQPSVDRGNLTGVNAFADDVNCYTAYNGGTKRGTDAFYIGHNSASFPGSTDEWITGYSVDANVRLGAFVFAGRVTGGSGGNAIVRAHTATVNSGGYAMTVPNNSIFASRNAGGSGFVDMFKVGTFDALALAPGGAKVAVGYAPSSAPDAALDVRTQTNIPVCRLQRQTGTAAANLIDFASQTGNVFAYITGYGRAAMDPGSVDFPSYTFAGGDQTTGIYHPADGQVGIVTSGAARGAWSDDGMQVGSASFDFGGGVGVIGIDDATTVPTTNPTGGGVLYVESGSLRWRGSSGTVTTIAPA